MFHSRSALRRAAIVSTRFTAGACLAGVLDRGSRSRGSRTVTDCGSRTWRTSRCRRRATASRVVRSRDSRSRRSGTCCSTRSCRSRSAGPAASCFMPVPSTFRVWDRSLLSGRPVAASRRSRRHSGCADVRSSRTTASSLIPARRAGRQRRASPCRAIPGCGCGAIPLAGWGSNAAPQRVSLTTRPSDG